MKHTILLLLFLSVLSAQDSQIPSGGSLPGCTSGGGALTCPNGFSSGTGPTRITGTEGSTPSAPGTGQQTIYLDSADHGLKTINSAGAVTPYLTASGTAATASALAGTPTLCPSGQAPTGILANGNATGCAATGGGGGGSWCGSSVLDYSTACWREEMYSNDDHWYLYAGGSGSSVSPYLNNGNDPGVYQMTAGAGSGNAAGIILSWTNSSAYAYYPPAAWTQVWVVQAVSSTLVKCEMGWGNAAANKGIYMTYDTSVGADWIGQFSNGATVDTGVAVNHSAYQNLTIGSDGTKVSFSVNGSTPVTICPSGCTATGTIPLGGADATSPIAFVINSDASNAKILNADFFAMTMTVAR